MHFWDRHPVLALELWAISSPAGSTAMVRDGSSERSEKSITHRGYAMPAMNTAFWWSIDSLLFARGNTSIIVTISSNIGASMMFAQAMTHVRMVDRMCNSPLSAI